MSDMPIYVEDMIDGAVSRIKNLNYTNTVTFAFITDTHNCTTYTERTLYAIDKISRRVPVSFTCFGGDYLCNNLRTPKEEAIRQHKELADLVNRYNRPDLPIMVANGNHDENSFGDVENQLTQQEVHDIIMSHHGKMFVCDENSPLNKYGYYDDEQNKLRAIFLDIMDAPITDGQQLRHSYVFGNGQLNWVANTALKLPGKDWGVVLFSHYSPIHIGVNGAGMLFGGNALWEILMAFKNGTSYSAREQKGAFFYDVSCDFSQQGESELIGYFFGHHHADLILKNHGTPIIGCLHAASDNFGFEKCTDGTFHCKTRGSGEESAFSMFTVNRTERRINCVRCGAGPDFSVEY